MASQLPAKLKTADIQRFVHRASQLDKFKPAVAYWCRYQALNNILTKGLQNADDECMQYAAKLMDTVEEMKTQHPEDKAISDESIAPAYVQRFGLDTFERADKTMRTNTVTAQTVDTFQAAMTFLDLLNIWQPIPQDITSKLKYAKYHAVRIAKALKAGEDPNATNPVQEPEPPQNPDDLMLDPDDPEVQALNKAAAFQPTVEDAPDEDGFVPPPQRPASAPRPMSSGVASPIPREPPQQQPPVSPEHQLSVGPSPVDSNPRKSSLGGGYFPETVSPPVAPPRFQSPPPSTSHAPGPSAPPATSPSEAASRAFYQNSTPSAPPARPAQTLQHQQPPVVAQPAYAPQPSGPPPGGYNDDDVAVAEAQKHARWAISALNFEDVPTAVSELRKALRTLGAG